VSKITQRQCSFLSNLKRNTYDFKSKNLSLLLKRVQGLKVSSRLISRALRKANLAPSIQGHTKEALQDEIKSTFQEYYKAKGDARTLRDTYMEMLAASLAKAGDGNQESILKALRQRERQRNSARKIHFIQGKLRTGSTTMITTTDSKGSRIDITDKAEMEKAILASNHEKFSQSFHTPFYQDPLKREFGFKGLTVAAQATLAGVYDSNYPISQSVLDVIAQWEIPEAVRSLGPLKIALSVEQYKSFWNKANENVSCYPSALSFSTMNSFDDDIA
jgi:hypothetical protein